MKKLIILFTVSTFFTVAHGSTHGTTGLTQTRLKLLRIELWQSGISDNKKSSSENESSAKEKRYHKALLPSLDIFFQQKEKSF